MARPQVFVSSTFYDLRYIRTSLGDFIEQMGYEPVLSEKGKIAYDPDVPLDESCYRDAGDSNIFVLIIGGRYGSAASEEQLPYSPEFYERYESITKKEFQAAISKDIPVYILVSRPVYVEYETFQKNRENKEIEYAQVESVNIFYLIDEILSIRRNNPLQQFDNYAEIETWLREQWAGLFRDLLGRRSELKQLTTLTQRMDELSSINKSLQRYMEEIVRVSATPIEANKIINEEKERQDEAKRRRNFEKTKLVAELINIYDVTADKAEELYRRAKSVDEIATGTAQLIKYDPKVLLELWRSHKLIRESVNESRNTLGLEPLDFLNLENEKIERPTGRSENKRSKSRTRKT